MNNIVITGNLTNDVEFNQTNAGAPIAKFTVAVNRGEEADFFNVTAFDPVSSSIQKAKETGRFLKGCHVEVSGEMRQSKYQDRQTGQNRTSWGVVARYARSDKKFNAAANGNGNGYPQAQPSGNGYNGGYGGGYNKAPAAPAQAAPAWGQQQAYGPQNYAAQPSSDQWTAPADDPWSQPQAPIPQAAQPFPQDPLPFPVDDAQPAGQGGGYQAAPNAAPQQQ